MNVVPIIAYIILSHNLYPRFQKNNIIFFIFYLEMTVWHWQKIFFFLYRCTSMNQFVKLRSAFVKLGLEVSKHQERLSCADLVVMCTQVSPSTLCKDLLVFQFKIIVFVYAFLHIFNSTCRWLYFRMLPVHQRAVHSQQKFFEVC